MSTISYLKPTVAGCVLGSQPSSAWKGCVVGSHKPRVRQHLRQGLGSTLRARSVSVAKCVGGLQEEGCLSQALCYRTNQVSVLRVFPV